jgi:hypothetical protein
MQTERAAVLERLAGALSALEPRRGTLFLINIGVPILVGLLRGEGTGGLLGGVVGLLLSLADTEGALGSRLLMAIMVACGIAIGGIVGFWLKMVHPVFWLAFFLAVFTAGLFNQLGKGPHFALRFGALSLAVVAGLPTIMPLDYAYAAGAVLLCIGSRSIDHALNGPLQFSGPWLGDAALTPSEWVRFALAYALAATVGLWIGIEIGSVRAFWISALTLVIMLPDLRATLMRGVDGVIGTALAVVVVWIIAQAGNSEALMTATILLAAFLLPSQAMRFWALSSMIAVIILLAWDLASANPNLEPTLLWERLEDMVIAACLVLITTTAAFPGKAWSLARETLRKA